MHRCGGSKLARYSGHLRDNRCFEQGIREQIQSLLFRTTTVDAGQQLDSLLPSVDVAVCSRYISAGRQLLLLYQEAWTEQH